MFSWVEPVYVAFWSLSRQRGSTFSGPDKLRTGDILQFFDAFMPYESKEEFYELITVMDECYIALAYEAMEKNKTKGGGITL